MDSKSPDARLAARVADPFILCSQPCQTGRVQNARYHVPKTGGVMTFTMTHASTVGGNLIVG